MPQFVFGRSLNYLWNPATYLNSDTTAVPISSPKADITYSLTLTGAGNCTVSDNVFIKVLLAPIVPNAFSPNGDGINDTWVIDCIENYPDNAVQIFDRWGDRIISFEGYNNTTRVWSGTNAKGALLPDGTYYYVLTIKNEKTRTGWVFLRSGIK